MQTTAIRSRPKAIACWRNRFQSRPDDPRKPIDRSAGGGGRRSRGRARRHPWDRHRHSWRIVLVAQIRGEELPIHQSLPASEAHIARRFGVKLQRFERTQIAMTDKPPEADPAAYRQRAPLRRGERLRRRAAWMYYVEEMTQSAVAEALGVGRVTVVRMLAEARALGEVRIALARGAADLAGLEIALAKALGVGEAIVAPLSAPDADPTAPIGAALGAVISELVADDMKIGLGWGLTLRQALDHLSERAAKAVTVVSLVGGVTHVGSINPAEFAWEFARAYNADCYLIPAPALVDSADDAAGLDRTLRPRRSLRIRPPPRRGRVRRRRARRRFDGRPLRPYRRGRAPSPARIRRGRRGALLRLFGRRAADRPPDQRARDVGAAGDGRRRADPGDGGGRRRQDRSAARRRAAAEADDAGDRRNDRADAARRPTRAQSAR